MSLCIIDYNILLFVFVLFCDSFAVFNKGETCFFQDGSEGKCKLMRECPIAQRLIKIGVFPVICGLEGTKSIVCCKDGEEETETTNTTSTITSSTSSRTPGDISKQKCKEFAKHAYEKIPSPTLLLYPHITKKFVCDIPRNRLVVGSSLAERREFPHMVLIGYFGVKLEWLCGGSLISENFVLTAANCLYPDGLGPARLVRVGFTNKSDPACMQERTVSELIPYPEFDSSASAYHDIGLLRLSKNVDFNTYARPACLYTERNIPFVSAIVSGWGSIDSTSDLSNDLLATVLEFYSVETCNVTYSKLPSSGRLLKNGIIDDLMFCAGASKSERSTCDGDGGGPLQVYRKETEDVKCMYNIIGVVSLGIACGMVKDLPDVFTRVSAYIKWIEYIVWPN